ncbi:hypothetical protein [Nocardia donostiensis]|uniref:DUF8020 domain-containing protein n=1 Tax=Nocardia donostiensis TaxID=1538463 RepID=A0A1V2TEP9_9NOCA|nr:hypothetical protein [Nocardia donostiensis]ONM47954.1 hypothetical protein B0T46_15060 [Nocardia donostiensis]OQS13133.1 hypothetical protein B0T36_21560 [Nocardia donostiensis]OQS21497.1 hypothetical protein B0T44_07665 [Nocardia donostiensis]
MKFGTFAATALLAVTAVGVSTATVHAEPSAAVAEQMQSEGVEQGVGYRTRLIASDTADTADAEQAEKSDPQASDSGKPQLADVGRTIETVVTNGRFALTEDGRTATLTSADGEVIAEVPLEFDLNGSRVSVAHEISDDGQRLALTPDVTAEQIGEMRPISSMSKLVAELEKNVIGLVVGGIVGGIIGSLIGLGFFSLLTGPIGLVVGAVAGGLIMGGQPFADAVLAVLNGEP